MRIKLHFQNLVCDKKHSIIIKLIKLHFQHLVCDKKTFNNYKRKTRINNVSKYIKC